MTLTYISSIVCKLIFLCSNPLAENPNYYQNRYTWRKCWAQYCSIIYEWINRTLMDYHAGNMGFIELPKGFGWLEMTNQSETALLICFSGLTVNGCELPSTIYKYYLFFYSVILYNKNPNHTICQNNSLMRACNTVTAHSLSIQISFLS